MSETVLGVMVTVVLLLACGVTAQHLYYVREDRRRREMRLEVREYYRRQLEGESSYQEQS